MRQLEFMRDAARETSRIKPACGPVNFGTQTSRLEWAGNLSWQPIPRSIALAARTADRICLGIGTNVGHLQSGRGIDLAQQPVILQKVTTVLRENYDCRFHRPGIPAGQNPNSAAIDDEFAVWIGIGGPPSYVMDRLGELVELGIDFFITSASSTEREDFAAQVMPSLRKLRA